VVQIGKQAAARQRDRNRALDFLVLVERNYPRSSQYSPMTMAALLQETDRKQSMPARYHH